jgi:hypothetical protein
MTLNISPTADNLYIGAGDIYLDKHVSDARTGYFHVGNVELYATNTADTLLEKYSSMRAARPLYARRLQRRLVTLKLQFDEFSYRNMELLMMADSVDYTQAASAVTSEVLFANVPAATLGAALGGKSFKVAKIGAISAVTVEVGAATAVLNTDYTVDLTRGVITILAASTVTTNGADDLTIDYTPAAVTAGQAKTIRGGTQNFIEVSGLFVPDPTTGPKFQLEFWNGAVAPDGDLNFISTDFSNASISIALQDDSAGAFGGSSASPLYSIIQY